MRRFSIELPLEGKYYDRASMFLNNTRFEKMQERKDFALLKSNNHYFLFCEYTVKKMRKHSGNSNLY